MQAQEDEDYRLQYREDAVAQIIERHSQRDQPPPPINISSSSSSSDNNSDNNSDCETGEPQRPRRGVQRTRKLIDNSQTAKDIAASKAPKGASQGRRHWRQQQRCLNCWTAIYRRPVVLYY
jgi:hypothetical protein